ncbi:cob(I)alamin adenosyltransferase [Halobacillus karajensis]|uniref:Corrinoid adenosyltransferase n=1 Tax=Halobacillus karajensis TaxID=195088 RepID=A0A024P5Z9_9BACI|nr:cob(I)yrinic acid a,c-diamide adenosyltransferase [Halobacillus karajensis]CDQ20363.1 Cob(I)yrinic acid a,c-diamide adenosyltransferase [Halobacillus karajensis]CDQ24168.1 Cob(I)yrinic acid a,c-diamide adenosyltransferase [Halobacillus karajensis]CDQ27646.1 Cob(I)yrinic acid a,c-diamide adenosyltransferase [Halobacillus karajensis]SEH92822.1 cob(I)alamin adenosyltransferase [Halobacillus karajensis]
MRIYTRSGDKGQTSLIYGQRVPKNDIRVEAYGTCDEANSMIGLGLSHLNRENWPGKEAFLQIFQKIQTILFHVGAELATPQGKEVMWKLKKEHIEELEKQIDEWDQSLEPLKNFILPSGHQASATFHLARTVVRRAERIAVALEDELNNPLVVSYLNRLSDFLFVAARYVNRQLGGSETLLDPDV